MSGLRRRKVVLRRKPGLAAGRFVKRRLQAAWVALGDEAPKGRGGVKPAFGAKKLEPAHTGGDVGNFLRAYGLQNIGAVFVAGVAQTPHRRRQEKDPVIRSRLEKIAEMIAEHRN